MNDIIFIISLTIVAAGALTLAAFVIISAKQERRELIAQLTAKDQDMLDRLMAKDLPEVKVAQREPTPGGITSKRRNDERIAEQNAKIARAQ